MPASITRLLFLLLSLATLPAYARLGESEAETTARYGPLLEAFDPSPLYAYRTLVFTRNDYLIEAMFIDGSCELVVFRKDDKSAFTRDDLDLILTANANGQAWAPAPLASEDVFWNRPDGAMARYDTANHALAVCSATYMRAEGFRRKVERQKALDSF